MLLFIVNIIKHDNKQGVIIDPNFVLNYSLYVFQSKKTMKRMSPLKQKKKDIKSEKLRKSVKKKYVKVLKSIKQNMVGWISFRKFKNKLSTHYQECLQIF